MISDSIFAVTSWRRSESGRTAEGAQSISDSNCSLALTQLARAVRYSTEPRMSSETIRLTPNPQPFATKLPARPTAVVPEVAARAIGAREAEDGDELIVDFLPEMTRLEQQRGELAFEREADVTDAFAAERGGHVAGRPRCAAGSRRAARRCGSAAARTSRPTAARIPRRPARSSAARRWRGSRCDRPARATASPTG